MLLITNKSPCITCDGTLRWRIPWAIIWAVIYYFIFIEKVLTRLWYAGIVLSERHIKYNLDNLNQAETADLQ